MIVVSCPSCATRFKMDKSLIPEKGRVVRCSSCQHKWRLVLPPLKQLYSKPDEETEKQSAVLHDHVANTGQFRDNFSIEKKKNIQSRLYIPFFIVLFIWIIGVVMLFIYPKKIVNYLPVMRGFYDSIGVEIEKKGLSLIQPFLEIRNNPDQNSNILTVRWTIMNTHPSEVQPLRPIKVSLRDKANFIVQEFLITQFEVENLAPGGIEDFSYEVPDLPENVIDVEITLIEE